MDVVLYGILAIVVAAVLFLLVSHVLPAGEQIAPSVRDDPPWDLPAERTLDADDIDSLRLPVAVRGYRFAETDRLLDRLAGELRARDAEIARLRGHGALDLGLEPVAAAHPGAADDPVAPDVAAADD